MSRRTTLFRRKVMQATQSRQKNPVSGIEVRDQHIPRLAAVETAVDRITPYMKDAKRQRLTQSLYR